MDRTNPKGFIVKHFNRYLSAGPCERILVIISGLPLALSSEAPPRKIKP